MFDKGVRFKICRPCARRVARLRIGGDEEVRRAIWTIDVATPDGPLEWERELSPTEEAALRLATQEVVAGLAKPVADEDNGATVLPGHTHAELALAYDDMGLLGDARVEAARSILALSDHEIRADMVALLLSDIALQGLTILRDRLSAN